MLQLKTCHQLFKIVLNFTWVIFITGCCSDPRYNGEIAPSRACKWSPNTEKTYYWSRRLSAKAPESRTIPDFSTPQSIFTLIDYALWNNPDTKKTWADARAAAFNVEVQESYLYPTLEVHENLAWFKEDGGSGNINATTLGLSGLGSATSVIGSGAIGSLASPNYFNVLITDLVCSYLIADFGGRSANISAAKQTLYAANWMHNRNLQTVIIGVINAYYNQINAGTMYLASLRTLEDAQVALDAAEKMFSAGVTNIADVLQARSSAAGAELNVVQAKGNYSISKGQLAKELGLSALVEIDLEVLPEKIDVDKVTQSVEDLMDIAKQHRPDLAAIYANLLQKEAELKSSWSSGMPNISANMEIENDYIFNYPALSGNTYTGALVVNIPIFNGFLYSSQLKEARAQVLSAYAQLESTRYNVLLDVLEAYYNYQTASENLGYSQKFLDSSTENYKVALANYKQGTGDILQVLNALKDLAQARSQFVQSRTNWFTSKANIAYATGTIGSGNEGLPLKRTDENRKTQGDI